LYFKKECIWRFLWWVVRVL